MKSDFMLAINQLCAERRLSQETVMEAVEAALISAYKRNFGAATNIEVTIDQTTGEAGVFAIKDIVEDVEDYKAEVSLEEARKDNPDAELGGTVRIESTPSDFGRIAAQTAKQVILQRIREAEREVLFTSYADRTGELTHGTIQSVDFHSGDAIVALEGGAEARLPAREQVPAERYRRGNRLRAYVLDVRRGSRGPQITLSRRTPELLRRLMELEVPEIFNGAVEIKAIAREAGSRSKIAVHATQSGVDPVGSCVGVRGGRIQNVVNELSGEKIDVVQWDAELSSFIANALSPAKVMNVLLEDNPEFGKTGTVIVPDRQLSLAIGKEGQNARLAAKLTGWRIDIKSASEAAEETLGRFEEAEIPPEDMDLMMLAESLLRKRQDGELSEEQQAMVTAGLEGGAESVLAEMEKVEDVKAEPEAEALADAPGEAEAVTEAEAGEPSEEAVEGELEEPAPARVLMDETDFEPTFDGAPIEDSLGWVPTEGQEDLYDGWAGVEEEKPAPEPVAWDSGKLWEKEEIEPPTPKKKKRRRGRQAYDYTDDDDLLGVGNESERSW